MLIKQWIVRVIQGFKRPESYHDKWKNTYFTKEVM